jgi:hypothetical protein
MTAPSVHARFHRHFTPTSASWLNMVELFLAEINRDRIRRTRSSCDYSYEWISGGHAAGMLRALGNRDRLELIGSLCFGRRSSEWAAWEAGQPS